MCYIIFILIAKTWNFLYYVGILLFSLKLNFQSNTKQIYLFYITPLYTCTSYVFKNIHFVD